MSTASYGAETFQVEVLEELTMTERAERKASAEIGDVVLDVRGSSGAARGALEEVSWRPRELDIEILRLLSGGQTTDAIARRLGVSERTVRRRLRAVADEIGVRSSIEAVVFAVRAGLI